MDDPEHSQAQLVLSEGIRDAFPGSGLLRPEIVTDSADRS